MTAEICILNKMGVAMAADSAVTINGRKIYNSANKLFSLSKFHPVGVMIYGNADFLRIPWETIIKVYRQGIGNKNFPTLKEFSDDFIHFLQSNPYPDLSSSENEEQYNLYQLETDITRILKDVIAKLNARPDQNPNEQIPELQAITNTYIEEMLVESEELPYIEGFDDKDLRKVLENYGDNIEKMIMETFEELTTDVLITNLKYIVANNLIKKFSETETGLVISGYGETEIFPSLYAYELVGKVVGKLKYRLDKAKKIDNNIISSIVPFAQSDMVWSFVRGINPEIENISANYLAEVFTKLPGIIINQLKEHLKEPESSNELQNNIEEQLLKIYHEYNEVLEEYKQINFISPIIEVVNSLPKDELAEMAESLINLTSFKRKVSHSLETVGGPVDVAVITKGDGFVWIKRKHYFNADLNQQFAQNYYRREKDEPITP